MPALSDVRFRALRRLGYTGATNDMLLAYLIENSGNAAAYGNNIHVNSPLVGGALSGPIPAVPSPVFQDTFVGTAGAQLPDHTPDVGVAWLQVGANLRIRDGGYCEANGTGSGANNPNFHSNALLGTGNPTDPERVEWRMSKGNGGTSLVQGVTLFGSVDGNNKVTFGLIDREVRIQTWQAGQIVGTETIRTLSENPPDFTTPLDHPFSLTFTGREVTFAYGPTYDPEFSVTRDYSALTGLGNTVGIILRAAGCRVFEISYGESGTAQQGSNPPTGHSLPFNTAPSLPIDNGDGTFDWYQNPSRASGRSFLSYNLETNNPGLTVGSKYRFDGFVDTLAGNSTIVASVSGSGYTVTASELRCGQPGNSVNVFAEFTIDDPTYTMEIRAGVGVTTNRTEELILRNPLLREVITDAVPAPDGINTLSGAWAAFLDVQFPQGTGQRNDDWYEYLGSLGYEGALNDRELQFWLAQ